VALKSEVWRTTTSTDWGRDMCHEVGDAVAD
jgi:hypothetical protein